MLTAVHHFEQNSIEICFNCNVPGGMFCRYNALCHSCGLVMSLDIRRSLRGRSEANLGCMCIPAHMLKTYYTMLLATLMVSGIQILHLHFSSRDRFIPRFILTGKNISAAKASHYGRRHLGRYKIRYLVM